MDIDNSAVRAWERGIGVEEIIGRKSWDICNGFYYKGKKLKSVWRGRKPA